MTQVATERGEPLKAQMESRPVTELSVAGMSCGNCARHVTEALQNVTGVVSTTVSLQAQQASVRWAFGAQPDPLALVQAVQAAGYSAGEMVAPALDRPAQRLAHWQINLWMG